MRDSVPASTHLWAAIRVVVNVHEPVRWCLVLLDPHEVLHPVLWGGRAEDGQLVDEIFQNWRCAL